MFWVAHGIKTDNIEIYTYEGNGAIYTASLVRAIIKVKIMVALDKASLLLRRDRVVVVDRHR